MTIDTEATREGAEAEEQQAQAQPEQQDTPEERPKTARELALEAIEESRRTQLAAETEAPDEEAAEPKARAEQPEPDEQPDQLGQQLAADDRFIDNDTLRAKVKLKIDGEEKVATIADLVRIAQKHEAADRRLAEATQLLSQARMQAAQPAQPLNTSRTPGSVNATDTDLSALQPTVRDAVKEAVDAMYRGDESAAADKLTETLLQIARATEERAASKVKSTTPDEVLAQLEQRSALQAFFGAYPAMLQGSVVDGQSVPADEMQALADSLLPTFLAKGYSYSEALDRTGRAVYATHGIALQQPRTEPERAPATTSRRQVLAERKASMDIPSGRSVSAAMTPEEPESSEAYRARTIAEIAASRNPALRTR